MDNLISKWHTSIEEINEISWNHLKVNNTIPFYTWKWLQNLEKSGSVNHTKGWQPLFLSIWAKNDLISVAPLYIKYHSYGEFIFDNLFNQLAIDIGINYYPKLVGMSPFSPVEGYKFIFAPGQKEEELSLFMLKKIESANERFFNSEYIQSSVVASGNEKLLEKYLQKRNDVLPKWKIDAVNLNFSKKSVC